MKLKIQTGYQICLDARMYTPFKSNKHESQRMLNVFLNDINSHAVL